MSLYQSLYETALKQGLPRPIIDVLVRVFANDVDFQRATARAIRSRRFIPNPTKSIPAPSCCSPR